VGKPLRIIGGIFRGRQLQYSGDARTRPMKDRVREAVFNLIGPAVSGKHAIDLFAGTGALGLEALSRGAARATFVERHVPTARIIGQNIGVLGVAAQTAVISADAFLWPRTQRDWSPFMTAPWLVFCSPPWDFFAERAEEMCELIRALRERAPLNSLFVVEADARFDFGRLTSLGEWDIRSYLPAVIGMHEVTGPAADEHSACPGAPQR
jgi:16S rRNA (guanine(966)-N(2))-methyltransferase RsmD